jgi:hypothetical protein
MVTSWRKSVYLFREYVSYFIVLKLSSNAIELLCCIQSLLFICIYVHIIYNIHYKLYFLLSLESVRLNKWRKTIKCCCQTYSCGRCLKINVAMYVSKVQEYFQLWKNTIKFVIKSEYSEFITYVFLYVSAIFVNKVNITYLWRKKLWMSGVKYVNTLLNCHIMTDMSYGSRLWLFDRTD